MYKVININGDGTKAEKEFETLQDAIDYSQWTAGEVVYYEAETKGGTTGMKYRRKGKAMNNTWEIERARKESSDTLRNWIWSAVCMGQPVPACLSIESLRTVLKERGLNGRGYHNT